MDKLHSRWGCRIIGEQHDLEFLDHMLGQSIRDSNGFFISKVDSLYILRSSRWDAEDNHLVVADRAANDLRIIAGPLALYRHTNQFRCGGVAEFAQDGKLINQHLNARYTIPENIKEIPHTLFGRLVYSENDNIREALYHFGQRTSWINIYMCYEALVKYYGKEKKLFHKFPEHRSYLDLIRRTANQYRHAFKAGYLLSNPIGMGSAFIVLRAVFEKIAEELPSRPIRDFGKDGYEKDGYAVDGGFLTLGLEIGEPTYKD